MSRVFVHDFKIIDRPYDEVAFRLEAGAEQVLEAAFTSARAEGEKLRSRIAPRSWPAVLPGTVEVRAGTTRDFKGSVIVGFTWNSPDKETLLPKFEGDVSVAPFGLDQTAVTIHGRYDLPEGPWVEGGDTLVLQRLAESMIRAFLHRLCESFGCAPVR